MGTSRERNSRRDESGQSEVFGTGGRTRGLLLGLVADPQDPDFEAVISK